MIQTPFQDDILVECGDVQLVCRRQRIGDALYLLAFGRFVAVVGEGRHQNQRHHGPAFLVGHDRSSCSAHDADLLIGRCADAGGSGAPAALPPGSAGADLANLLNKAALMATRRGTDTVTISDFSSAVEAHRRGGAEPGRSGLRDSHGDPAARLGVLQL